MRGKKSSIGRKCLKDSWKNDRLKNYFQPWDIKVLSPFSLTGSEEKLLVDEVKNGITMVQKESLLCPLVTLLQLF